MPEFFASDDSLLSAPPATAADLAAFERRFREGGTPLADAHGWRWTFAWHAPEEVAAVHLSINRVTDKGRHQLGAMRRIPGTAWWVRTVELSPTLRASYGFVPLHKGEAPPSGPPPYGRFATLRDPLNPLPPVAVGAQGTGLSEFRGPTAPAQPEWDEAPSHSEQDSAELPADVLRHTLPLPEPREVFFVPPPSKPSPDPLLLVLFDAEQWLGPYRLLPALTRGMASGRLPRLAVLGVPATSVADRKATLPQEEFLAAVLGTAVPWARRQLDAAGHAGTTAPVILAGQSLGGFGALRAALAGLGKLTGVIAQSPSLWWDPSRDAGQTPATLGSRPTDWLTHAALTTPAPPRAPRLWLDVGLREQLSVPHLLIIADALRASGWDAQVQTVNGGHDYAWWRGTLLDHLAEFAAQYPASHPAP